jgi:hypothetical protein
MRQLHDHATLMRAVRADPNGEAATTGKVRNTIRQRLLKIGAIVTVSTRRAYVKFTG